MNKAVNVLVAQGVAFKKRGIGMFVCEGVVDKLIEERRNSFKQNYVKATLKEAKRLRYSIEDLQRIVKEVFEEGE